MASYNVGFVIEQVLGHITHTKNLQRNIGSGSDVHASWGLLHFDTPGLGGRIPLYKSNWTIRAGLRARSAIQRIAQERRLDALFFHTQVPALFALDWMRRVPSIVSIDATPAQIDALGRFYEHPQGPGWMERAKWQLNRSCFRAASHVVAWSAWAKQGLVEEYDVPAEKVTVVPPGVTLEEWMRPEARRREEGPVKILFVGGDFRRKGGYLLLEAFRELRALGVELHLVTRDQVSVEPGVSVYNDMQPNSAALKALYHSCHIFALPTYGETLGLVFSEAGAAGMATVATRLAAIPEIVQDGNTGLTVPVDDTAALHNALRLLVEQPELRLSMGERAIAHVRQAYDAQKNARRLLDLIKAEADKGKLKGRAAA